MLAVVDTNDAANGSAAAYRERGDCGVTDGESDRLVRLSNLGGMPIIAHEIRQPLTAMTTFAHAGLRWLNRDSPNLEEARRALEKAVDAADAASQLVDGIDRLARRGSLATSSFAIADLLPNAIVAAACRTGMEEKIVALECEASGYRIRGDRMLLGQVIVNLLANALQAVRDCGEPRVALRSLRRDGSALIEISDNGPGFSRRARRDACTSFYSSRPAGMGAGLLFSRCAVEAMGGKLLLGESCRLGGATIAVMLPLLD